LMRTWATTSGYFQDLSKTVHQPHPPKSTQSPSLEPGPDVDNSELDREPSRFPVQAALSYSSQRLERDAYRMASKTLPDNRIGLKGQKTHSWSLKQMTSTSTSISDKHEHEKDHGRLHDATSDTGHFAIAIMRTGFHGMYLADLVGEELEAENSIAPVVFLYNLANGFHNAPSFILNDTTVRRRDKITGLGSGAKVAVEVESHNPHVRYRTG
jgi:sterol 3beta-glucosyltransferase